VDDACCVGFGHGLAGVEDVTDGVLDGHLAVDLEDVVEVASLEELHDHKGRAARELADVEDAGDVLALEANGGLGLAEEAGHGVGHGRAEEELDGDALVEDEVRGLHHDPDAASSEDAVDLVFASDDIADGDGHLAVREGAARGGDARGGLGSCGRGSRGFGISHRHTGTQDSRFGSGVRGNAEAAGSSVGCAWSTYVRAINSMILVGWFNRTEMKNHRI
jgi:hypothetical protein